MHAGERQTYELVTASTTASLAKECTALLNQPPDGQVRGLARLCRQLSQQYQQTPQRCLERSWWRLFNEAGIRLREALDQAKAEGYAGLSDREVEQAYFLLIHVAYFFAPGSLAEALWPLLPAEPGTQQAKSPASDAFGVAFGTPAYVRQRTSLYQHAKRCFLRLSHALGRSGRHERETVQLLELPGYGPLSLDEGCGTTAVPGKEAS